ncbi:MAG TPA: hypothetical protein PLF41_13565, partial [Anaerolineales bacterium]|nr:hypothetical protein [Anaerolineales bacterium]
QSVGTAIRRSELLPHVAHARDRQDRIQTRRRGMGKERAGQSLGKSYSTRMGRTPKPIFESPAASRHK